MDRATEITEHGESTAEESTSNPESDLPAADASVTTACVEEQFQPPPPPPPPPPSDKTEGNSSAMKTSIATPPPTQEEFLSPGIGSMLAGVQTLLETPRACGYFDQATLEGLTTAILLAACEAAQLAVVGNPFPNMEKVVTKELERLFVHAEDDINELKLGGKPGTALGNNTNSKGGLQRLRDRLTAFADRKSGFLKRAVLSSEAQREQGQDLLSKLEHSGASNRIWPPAHRQRAAMRLVGLYDIESMAHCRAVFEYEEDLVHHRMNCPFRPVECENLGCADVFSFGKLRLHDENCAHKLIPCQQGCELKVKRKEMGAHITGPCGMRLVHCLYAPLGCIDLFYQKDIDCHLERCARHHLAMVFTHQVEADQRIDSIQLSMDQFQAIMTKNAEVSVSELHRELNTLKKDSDQARLDRDQARLDLQKTQKDFHASQKELQQLRKDFVAMQKDVAATHKALGVAQREISEMRKPGPPPSPP